MAAGKQSFAELRSQTELPLGNALPEAPLRERLTPNQIAWRARGTEITGVHIPVSIGGRYNTLRRPHLYPPGQNGQTNR